MTTFDKEPAYVLHRRPYQELNSLVQFLTPGYGRVTAVVRQSSKMLGKNVQSFIPVLLSCGGRGELLNMRAFDPQGKAILTAPREQMTGMYVNELVTRLIPPHAPSRRLFEHYVETLTGLADGNACEPVLRRFELKLLEISGHGLQLEHDHLTHEPLAAGAVYSYEPGEGPVRGGRTGAGAVTCRGETLLELARGLPGGDPGVLREAKLLLRTMINYYLRNRPMHTRSLFRYLKEVT